MGKKESLLHHKEGQLFLRLCSIAAIVWVVAEQYSFSLPRWASICRCSVDVGFGFIICFGQWNVSDNMTRALKCTSPFDLLVLNSGVPPTKGRTHPAWPLPFHLCPRGTVHGINLNPNSQPGAYRTEPTESPNEFSLDRLNHSPPTDLEAWE